HSVQDWHTEWTDPAQAPEFYKGLRALDCPLCGAWVLYKDRQIQAIAAGDTPHKTRRLPLQAARWAKSQSREGNLRDYLDQSAAGSQYAGYFADNEIQDADADAQADPRYWPCLLRMTNETFSLLSFTRRPRTLSRGRPRKISIVVGFTMETSRTCWQPTTRRTTPTR